MGDRRLLTHARALLVLCVGGGAPVFQGMWMAGARKLCPAIVVLPYNFARIQAVSEEMYHQVCQVRAWVVGESQ